MGETLAVAIHDPRYNQIDDVQNVEPHVLKEIEQFFNVFENARREVESRLVEEVGGSEAD